MKIKIYFAGVDYWNRPVFKNLGGRLYFCDVEHLVNYDVTEEQILEHYRRHGTAGIIFKGWSLEDEPQGGQYDVELITQEQAKLLRHESK